MVQTTSNDVAKTYHNFDWRLGLDYDVSDTAFVYGYLATGYKAGSITDVYVRGADTLHPEGPGSVVNTSYGPEEALTFEMGYKASYLENRLKVALTIIKLNMMANNLLEMYQWILEMPKSTLIRLVNLRMLCKLLPSGALKTLASKK